MKKTATENWAFRWYANPRTVPELLEDEEDRRTAQARLEAWGLGKLRACGGMAGYEKNTFMQRTFALSPKTDDGLLRLFAADGSYKPALAMVPREAAFALAGQVDPKVAASLIHRLVAAEAIRHNNDYDDDDDDDDEGGELRGGELEESDELSVVDVAAALKNIDDIAAGSNGLVAVFITKIERRDYGSFSRGLVLGMKDEKTALDAMASMRELIVNVHDGNPRKGREPKPDTYRDVVLQPLGSRAHAAVVGDRLIVSFSPVAVRQAVDAALDAETRGGFAKDSRGEAYLAQAGDGHGVFFVDVASLVESYWPMLRSHLEYMRSDNKIKIPTTEMLLKHLGPEVAVFQHDADGLLIQSPGLLPFATHLTGMMIVYNGYWLLP